VRDRRVLFWDFDGVIKESVGVKTEAYVRLFEPFGAAVAARVREHHEAHGGMSRFEKLPLYIGWAGRSCSPEDLARYCELFSAAVFQAVIDSAWVPGAREYLEANHQRQRFVILTATPQKEIEDILSALGIAGWFCEVHGAPTAKSAAIETSLKRLACRPSEAMLIGDSESDFSAAAATQVEFVLRCTPLNLRLQRRYSGLKFKDFLDG
jgi:phosphoglycolate phosphatase-like HAD superfamily hydrolase